jgi:hypothetical protein
MNFKLETETWHDQRPTHRPIPDYITEARAATNRAQTELDEFHETAGASTEWTPELASEFERLLNARNAAIEWENDCIEIASRGEIPASILYAVRMREEAR